jgi:hypothetical protein
MSACPRCGYIEMGHNAADREHSERCRPPASTPDAVERVAVLESLLNAEARRSAALQAEVERLRESHSNTMQALTAAMDGGPTAASLWQNRAEAAEAKLAASERAVASKQIIGHISRCLCKDITVPDTDGIKTEYVFGRIFKNPQPDSIPVYADHS